MSDEDIDFPGVRSSGSLEPEPRGHRYVHIDDFDRESYDQTMTLHLYVFESEDREGELVEMTRTLREEYILASGIIWPDELREHVEDADTYRMRALEWAYVLLPYTEHDVADIPAIADQAEAYFDPR